jgi:5-(carboxyamino)imidazole ribonucleotide mutase
MALKVLVVMGSDSDLEQIVAAIAVLKDLAVPVEVSVASAHRSPDRVVALARGAVAAGIGVVIAAAGGAAHLAGVMAANTTLPVVAVPLSSGALGGLDALLSSVQMPGGIPIASVGINSARNAGLFAAAILAVTDSVLASRLVAWREAQTTKVEEADARVRVNLAGRKLGS